MVLRSFVKVNLLFRSMDLLKPKSPKIMDQMKEGPFIHDQKRPVFSNILRSTKTIVKIILIRIELSNEEKKLSPENVVCCIYIFKCTSG